MQSALVFLILIACFSYAGWRIYKAVRSAGDPCYGCNGCELKKQLRKNRLKNKGSHDCLR